MTCQRAAVEYAIDRQGHSLRAGVTIGTGVAGREGAGTGR